MFSRFGRIFSIDVGASTQSFERHYWVTMFRTLKTDAQFVGTDEMRCQHHNIASRASVERVRRAQDRLMEGKHE